MKKIFIIFLSLATVACSSENGRTNEDVVTQSLDTVSASTHQIPKELMSEMIRSIPSPLELSYIIKDAGIGYNPSFLNSPENVGKYNTNYKKALNLGIYGTDMGYVNIYGKSKDILFYLNSVKTLADNLNIGQFFDFHTLKTLAQNSENLDSLLYISTNNFEKINAYLHEHKRSDQSVLLLTGGWLEALHLSCQVAKYKKNDKLYEKIGEQKIILDQLLLLLSNFNKDANILKLENQLKDLKTTYDEIEITYKYKESVMEEKNGILVVTDKSESIVNITPAQVEEITAKVENIRNEIIN